MLKLPLSSTRSGGGGGAGPCCTCPVSCCSWLFGQLNCIVPKAAVAWAGASCFAAATLSCSCKRVFRSASLHHVVCSCCTGAGDGNAVVAVAVVVVGPGLETRVISMSWRPTAHQQQKGVVSSLMLPCCRTVQATSRCVWGPPCAAHRSCPTAACDTAGQQHVDSMWHVLPVCTNVSTSALQSWCDIISLSLLKCDRQTMLLSPLRYVRMSACCTVAALLTGMEMCSHGAPSWPSWHGAQQVLAKQC